MDMSKKSLILSIVTIFVCIAVSVVCLVVMKCDWVSLVLTAVVIGLAIYVCVFCFLVAKRMKNEEQVEENKDENVNE